MASKQLTVRIICKILKKHGFQEISQNGSHRKFKKENRLRHVIVAGKDSQVIKRGTINNIIRCSGLSRACFNDECNCEL